MSSSDDRLRQFSADLAAGRITDAEYQAAYEAVDATRARPKGMTQAGSSLPASGLPRRTNTRTHEKLFGSGRPIPLDRNAKARIVHLARALSRRTERGKHYGLLTAKALEVLRALLFQFHNAKDGRCFPSYQTLAEAAGCATRTVATAIKALEDAGLLTWCIRLKRAREWRKGLGMRVRVLRTSNGYRFFDPAQGTECKISSGTPFQDLSSLSSWALRPSSRSKGDFEGGGARFVPISSMGRWPLAVAETQHKGT